jgi:protein SCO1/2
MMSNRSRIVVLALLLTVLPSLPPLPPLPLQPLWAQDAGAPAPGYRRDRGVAASTRPAVLREIGFDQNLDAMVPLDTALIDETGHAVRLGDYFGSRPVVLVFAYYECPMLCGLVINGLAQALRVLSIEPGADFEVVVVSIDPRDTPATAAAKKMDFLTRYARASAAGGAHFLTAEPGAIDQLTAAAGFRYAWDEPTQQFAHPSGVIVLTPEGRIARYLFGIEYSPRDLRLAVVEASAGKVGTPVDALLLYCYHYDPLTGRYGLVIMRALRLAGAATVLGLVAFIAVMLRRERRQAHLAHESTFGPSRPGAFEPRHPRAGASEGG